MSYLDNINENDFSKFIYLEIRPQASECSDMMW